MPFARDAIAEIVSSARPVPNIYFMPCRNDNYLAKPLEGYDPALLACQTRVVLKGEELRRRATNKLAAFFAALRAGRVAQPSDLPDNPLGR